MAQPVLFVLDDDPGVTRALRDDLGRRFGEDFRVIGESSAAAGLATLREIAGTGDRVALLIVDHNMSEMPGVDFLARAHEMHPQAKRVLLVERDYSVRWSNRRAPRSSLPSAEVSPSTSTNAMSSSSERDRPA